jgi:hypothetical protein
MAGALPLPIVNWCAAEACATVDLGRLRAVTYGRMVAKFAGKKFRVCAQAFRWLLRFHNGNGVADVRAGLLLVVVNQFKVQAVGVFAYCHIQRTGEATPVHVALHLSHMLGLRVRYTVFSQCAE